MAAIRLQQVSFRYRGVTRWALREVSLEIQEGQFVVVTGPSASGKSTLLRVMNGLIPHFYDGRMSGTVEVLGQDTRLTRPNLLASRIGTVFQFPEDQVVASKVWRDVAFGPENLMLDRSEILQRVEEALGLVGLSEQRDRMVHTLSGGQLQRLVLASTLAMHPSILLLDEPASELDPRARIRFLATLERLSRAGRTTTIVADHRLEDLLPLADRLVVLSAGRVTADGDPRTVLRESDLHSLGIQVPWSVRIWRRLSADADKDCPLTTDEVAALMRNSTRTVHDGTALTQA